MNIELLEARIAPASAFFTYTDIDGDLVKIAASTPGGPPLNLAGNVTFVGGGMDGQLARLDLTDPSFTGANITFTVTKAVTGNGLAHVGEIAALGVDLGVVKIKGDLGSIDAGNVGAPALKSLTALSMGAFGAATGAVANGDGTLESTIHGRLGALKVTGDVTGVWINVSDVSGGDGTGDIGAITIGGSLVGGTTLRAGHIKAVGDIGAVKIGRDLVGAAGDESGKIDAGGKLKRLTIGGSIRGGGGHYDTFVDGNFVAHTGQVFAGGDIGVVKVTRDVVAGNSAFSAAIHSHGALGGSVTIGGSIIDFIPLNSDTLIGDAQIGVVKIGRDMQGDITSFGTITSLTIGGSARIGFFTSTGAMGPVKIGGDFQTNIEAGTTLAALIVTGSLSGTTIHSGGQMGLIKIGGDLVSGSRIDSDAGITSLVVGGSITGPTRPSIESVGQIGKIDVRGSAALKLTTTAGGLDKLTVGGSLFVLPLDLQGALGSMKVGSLEGDFNVSGDIGSVQIAHDLMGFFDAASRVKSLTVGGDFRASVTAVELSSLSVKGAYAGSLRITTLGTMKVAGDMRGFIEGDEIRAISIGGSVIFQNVFLNDGLIFASGRIGALKIGGDVQGPGLRPGDSTVGGGVFGTIGGGSIGSVFIGGSLRAGTDESTMGALDIYPLILSQHEIGSVTILGDVRGTVGSGGDVTDAAIVALNQVAGLTTDLAIGKVTIGGTVERATIFAGTGPVTFAGGTNGNASIGAVKVGGDWIASSITAGVRDVNGDGFGNADDDVVNVPPGAEADAIVARIASIAIKGAVIGTAGDGDHFGFVAQQIGSFKMGGLTAPLTTGTNVYELAPHTGDVTVREV
jgi:hypothetical protein